MSSIKYTLSRDRRFRSDDPAKEAAWLARAHELHYALPNRPRRVSPGDVVYFIHAGKMKARARVSEIIVGKARRTYTRKRRVAAPIDLGVAAPIEIAKRSVKHRGFQGFRYVTVAEQASFDRAFV